MLELAKRFQPRPEPTTWEDDKELDKEFDGLREPLQSVSGGNGGFRREFVLPRESHEFLATVTAENYMESSTAMNDLKSKARLARPLMRDEAFISAAKLLLSRCQWIEEAKRLSFAIRQSVGPRYGECCLANFTLSIDKEASSKQTQVLAQMSDLIDNMPNAVERGASLFIFGPVGSGKDHLLTAAMIRAARCGYTVRWFNGLDLYGSFRDSMDGEKPESSQLRPLVDADVLALSDPIPPVGEVTPFQRSMLFRVIDRRYRDRKPTWITANVATRAEADQRFGAQLVDRITDGALRLQCNWPSHRADRKWTNGPA